LLIEHERLESIKVYLFFKIKNTKRIFFNSEKYKDKKILAVQAKKSIEEKVDFLKEYNER